MESEETKNLFRAECHLNDSQSIAQFGSMSRTKKRYADRQCTLGRKLVVVLGEEGGLTFQFIEYVRPLLA
jgi:hypothetical protein